MPCFEGISDNNSLKIRQFRFEPFWLKEEDCTDVVKEAWSKVNHVHFDNATRHLRSSLTTCGAALRSWSFKKLGSIPSPCF